MVVAGRVEGEVAEEFAGDGVHDPDLQVLDEHDHVGSGVGSADPDVVELAVDAQGDHAAGVDPVVADPVVGEASRLSCRSHTGWTWLLIAA